MEVPVDIVGIDGQMLHLFPHRFDTVFAPFVCIAHRPAAFIELKNADAVGIELRADFPEHFPDAVRRIFLAHGNADGIGDAGLCRPLH